MAPRMLRRQFFEFAVQVFADRVIRLSQQVVDHTLQTQGAAVIGVVNSGNAVVVQFLYFVGQDGSAAAAEQFDVRGPFFA